MLKNPLQHTERHNIMGRVTLLIILVLVLTLVGTACETDTTIEKFDLTAGICYNDPLTTSEQTVDVYDCNEPHDNEVFADFNITSFLGRPDLDANTYPSQDVLETTANLECVGLFEDYVGIDYYDSVLILFTYWPTPESWSDGDREVICIAYDRDNGQMDSSIKNSKR